MSKAKERKHFTSRKGEFSIVQNASHVADVCEERDGLKRKLETSEMWKKCYKGERDGLEKQLDMQKARTEAQRDAKRLVRSLLNGREEDD